MSTSHPDRLDESAGFMFLVAPAIAALLTFGVLRALVRLGGSLQLAAARPAYALTYTGGVLSWLSSHPEYLYHSLEQAPFVPTIYPPLYPLTIAGLHILTGLPVPILQRGLGLFAIGGTAALLGLTVYRTTNHRAAAVVAGGIYALAPAVSRSTTLARVDHLAMLFAVAAVYWWITQPAGERATVTAAALSLAVLSKHIYAVIGLVFLLDAFVVGENRRDGYELLLSSCLAAVAIGGGIWVWTHGRVWTHLVTINASNPLVTQRLVDQLLWAGWGHLPVVLLGAIVVWQYDHDRPDAMPAAAPLLVVVGALLFVGTVGKVGSWIGYAYPLLAGAALSTGYLAARVFPSEIPYSWVPAQRAAMALLVMLAAQGVIYGAWAPSSPTDAADQQAAGEIIAGADGPVLSEDLSLLTATGADPAGAYEPLVLKFAILGGDWDGRVAARIRAGEYAYIVTWTNVDPTSWTQGRWTKAQAQAIDGHYRLVETHGKYHIYEPTEAGES